MSDAFSIDSSEIDQLAADLGAVPATAGRFLRSAVEVSSRRVKDDWRDESKGLEHAPAFPYSVGYDVTTAHAFGQTVLKSEIGPDKERAQGALGNLIEFGSINNPPQGLGHGALQRNEDDFERGLSKALVDAERAAANGLGLSVGQVLR
jgi:hypothetical protein